HWHIDYFLKNENSKISEVFVKAAGKKGECLAAKKLLDYSSPVPRFGCSDCCCRSHFFFVDKLPKKIVL
ncbi:DUF123 domain-containing protein, partial [Candidatus Woesearchaeota archaeon]|nr:DUF123 domain-containing protein [Candidatus Woesearchaeota archaeon]